MKLKKLLTPVCWAIIVAMGITLTGCDLNGRGVLDEISSVMNGESSLDTNTESSNGGKWVQTETRYFAYKNGEEQYVSKQNEY